MKLSFALPLLVASTTVLAGDPGIDHSHKAVPTPPVVQVSVERAYQADNKVKIIFDWNQNVISSHHRKSNFAPKDVVVRDNQGKRLKMMKWMRKELSSERANEGYYGGLFRMPAIVPAGTHRFVGVVQGPIDGFIDVSVPAGVVCAHDTSVCNEESNTVRVQIDSKLEDCAQIESVTPKKGGNLISATVEFPADVSPGSFSLSSIYAFAYNIGPTEIPGVRLTAKQVTGGPRRFQVSFDTPEDPRLDLFEVFVDGRQVHSVNNAHFW